MKMSRLDRIDGVVICDLTPAQPSKDAFLELTRQAMALIKSLDGRRYRRVCRYLHYIANTVLISRGQYGRILKICRIDYATHFNSPHPLRNVRDYAGVLIHEATHGLLFAKGIPYNKKTWERVERLCHRESYRFALHFETGYADLFPGNYNPEWHKRSLESSVQARRTAWWKRFQEAWRSSFPKNAREYQQRARAHTHKGAHDKAVADCDEALRLDPQFADAYFTRGTACLQKRHYEKAIEDYDHGIQLNPKDARAYLNRGTAYLQMGNYDKAIADADQAIQLNRKDAAAYINRGTACLRRHDYDRAIADYGQAIQLNPKDARAYVNRGTAYLRKLDYEKAIVDYEYAIQLNPRHAAACKSLASVLATCPEAAFRDGKKAVEHATKACVLSDWKDSGAIKTLAAACAETADFDNAVKWQTKYLEAPNLSSSGILDAKNRLELYQAHKL